MMNLLIPKVKNIKKIIPFMILGIFIASTYGAIHDQISYSISPEYFTEFKFYQFDYADFSLPNRIFVSIIGVLATWWVGMITGWFLGRIRYYKEDLDSAQRDILVGFFLVFFFAVSTAFLGAIAGYIRAYYFPVNSFLGWENELSYEALRPFIVVAFIHTAGYIGGFIGLIYACKVLKRHSKLQIRKHIKIKLKILYFRIKNTYFKIINLMHLPFVKPASKDPYHAVFKEFIALSEQKDSPSILEIGSRNVSGITRRDLFPHCKDYVGFDIHSGEGVDIVGDAHKLSESFPPDNFDFVYSMSVFEHILFPWKVVMEINKITKTGGYVFISTHPVWAEHELPWDFWRFPRNSFHSLFNKYTGFEIISVNEGLPCKIYSLSDDTPTQPHYLYTLNQGVAVIAKKTGNYRSDLLKWDIDIEDVVDTMYPPLKPS